MNKIIFSFFILVGIVFSNSANSQIERKKAVKTCEGCKWRDSDTYFYMKPNGKVVYETGLNRHRFSYESEKDYWSFVYLADPTTKALKVLLNYRTTEFFIDLRDKPDGFFDDIKPYFQYSDKYPNQRRDAGLFFTVYYDGGSTVVDTNMNVIIPFIKGEKFFVNSGNNSNLASLPTDGMVDENDWAFIAWPSKRRFKLNGEEVEGDKTSEMVVKELEGGFTFRKDEFVYSPSGKKIERVYEKPLNSLYLPSIHRLIVFINTSGKAFLFNTETEEYISIAYFNNYSPEVMQDRYVFLGSNDAKYIFDLVTGKQVGESHKKLVFQNGKFLTASNGTELDTELDPTTGNTKNVGYENEKYSYKDVDVVTPSTKQADQTLCLSYDGKIIRGMHNFSVGQIDLRIYAKDGKNYTTGYISVGSNPHRMIPLKKGGYALAARNHFSWLDTSFSVVKSTGSKMLDWRATNQSPNDYTMFMTDWKQNSGESAGTAIDFLDLAENTTSTMIASVFLYHQWTSYGAEEMRLGLAIRTMGETSEIKFHDLNIIVPNSSRYQGPQDIAEEIKIAFIDENHLVIGYCGSNDGVDFQATVINTKKIMDALPLDAQVWQGKLKEMGSMEDAFGGLYAEDGILYYAMSGGSENFGVYVGKAQWNGTALTVLQNKNVISIGNVGKPHVLSNLNNSTLILSGISYSSSSSFSMQPYAVVLSKSNLTVNTNDVLLRGDQFFDAQVVDAVSINPKGTENKFMLLFRGRSNDKGAFYMSEIKVK
jgi:hypothetical protein